MRKNKLKLFFVIVIILATTGFIMARQKLKKPSDEIVREITPVISNIRLIISSTGTVLPKNRLEVRPPVNGRIEKILVKEGDSVKAGQIIAWMSSTERAALLDAARGKGEETLQYWETVYKPIPLSAPIDGEVIVATTQPGQAVTSADAVLVLSDQLIVRAQVDETDIGKIANGMKAFVTLDAYPDIKIQAQVEHIYYESQTVNNVTIYPVDLIPQEVPPFFRSGMNASVDFIVQDKKGVLVIPVDAVYRENGNTYVFVNRVGSKEPQKVRVELGITDDKNIEVISGITDKDCILEKSKRYTLPKSSSTGTNPFMPRRH